MDRIIDGKDISSLLLYPDTAESPHDVLYYEFLGVRDGKWKLVKKDESMYELYDLVTDIGESNDMASLNPDKVAELRALLDAHIASVESDRRPRGEMEDLTPLSTNGMPSLANLLGLDYLDVHPEVPIRSDVIAKRIDDRDTATNYRGTWTEHTAGICFTDTCSVGTTPYASVTRTFNGSGVSWYGDKRVDHGIAHVYIDDLFMAEIDCYSPVPGAQQLFTKSDLIEGTHIIEIVRTENKHPSSSGYNIVHDYFETFSGP